MTAVDDRTRRLVAPAPPPVGGPDRAALRGQLVARLGPLVAPLPAGDPVVVTLPLLRQAQGRPESLGERDDPFVWRPAFVRRSLGLAVTEACAGGRFRSPLEAVGPVATDAVERWEETGWRTYHWEPWVAGLPPGARAVVLAEAVGWASSLWSSLDWSLMHPLPHFGGADDQWACPSTHSVRLKGRSELHLPLGHGGTMALVSVSGGCPSEGWRGELAFLALVASLRSPSRPAPVRVLGLWPEAGVDRCLEIDPEILGAAVDRVVGTVAAVAASRRGVAA